MNSLSPVIMNAAKGAAEEYKKISGFECLHWGHESFLVAWVAMQIHAETNRHVFVDTSLESIGHNAKNNHGEELVSSRIVKWRPDICVWGDGDRYGWIESIVEVKTQPWSGGIYKDGNKSLEYMKCLPKLNSAFILTFYAYDGLENYDAKKSKIIGDGWLARLRRDLKNDKCRDLKSCKWLDFKLAFSLDKKVIFSNEVSEKDAKSEENAKAVWWNLLLFELKRESGA